MVMLLVGEGRGRENYIYDMGIGNYKAGQAGDASRE